MVRVVPHNEQTRPDPTPLAERSHDATPQAADAQPLSLRLGQSVRLVQPQRYLKTADPMPMLRPPDLVDHEEWGEVQELRALQQVAVRFRRGTFVIPVDQLCCTGP